MAGHRYKFDFRDPISRVRVKGAAPGKAVNIKVRVANDPASPSIPAFAELEENGDLVVTFTNLAGKTGHLRLHYDVLMWEIHCRELASGRLGAPA